MTAHPKYRADIDGLRSLAILSVLFYHAFPQTLRGGFVGVDVFFIISGFLISTIIFSNLKINQFGFKNFYFRRVKRIFPALLIVLMFCLALGWIALLDIEYKQLGKHIAAAAGFVSNIVLWFEGGYFDTASELKPLLHLWSLGIEEQFYFVWPLFLWVLWKRNFSFKIHSIIYLLIITVSFAYSLKITRTDPIAAFYSPLSRIWELALGSYLSLLTLQSAHFQKKLSLNNPLFKDFISVLGFGLIIFSVFFIKKDLGFPGWQALLPTLGAVLAILAGPNALINKFVLSKKVLVWIGLISYPLYLWHWPLLSFSQIIYGEVPPVSTRLIMIGLSFLLAWLTYNYIEKYLRFGKKEKLKVFTMCLSMLIIGLAGYGIYYKNGLTSRPINARQISRFPYDALPIRSYPTTDCFKDPKISKNVKPACVRYLSSNPSRPTIVLWGDSSSSAWAHIFTDLATERDYNIYLISHAGCLPLLDVRKTHFASPEARKFCSGTTLGREVIDSIKKINPQLIFVFGAWNLYTPALSEETPLSSKEFVTESMTTDADQASTVAAFKNKLPLTLNEIEEISPVIVFRSWPVLDTAPNYGIQRIDFLQNFKDKTSFDYEKHKIKSQFINEIFDSLPLKNTQFLDPALSICKESCHFLISNRRMYVDTYHITPQGTFLYRDEILKMIEQKIK